VTGGPKNAPNNGMELKLQLFFMHSGVAGANRRAATSCAGERRRRLPIPDSVRSVTVRPARAPWPLQLRVQAGARQAAGQHRGGNYVGWVLDGNGERDSQNFTFSVPAGQGEVWIQFDQNR